jgi:hypothetical protein
MLDMLVPMNSDVPDVEGVDGAVPGFDRLAQVSYLEILHVGTFLA